MMFSETFSYYNTYNGTKRHHDANGFGDHRQKRRRLVDHLSSLNIGNPSSTTKTESKENRHFTKIFGDFDNVPLKQKNQPYENPHRILIKDIDRFLKENPEQLDLLGDRISFDELEKSHVINNDILIDKGALKRAWDRLASQYKNGHSNSWFSSAFTTDKDKEDVDIDELVKKLVWEEYILKYFSMIKYYNPLQVIWDSFLRWQEEHIVGTQRITELNYDGLDDEMASDSEIEPCVSNEIEGMSNYGSYYDEDHPWDNVDYDDDVMMD